MEFKRKTYADSWLYMGDPSRPEMIENQKRTEKNLLEFVLKADRIDKNSDAFRGILEDVKRQQASSILYTVLTMENVVFCINTTELPRAFKVFESKDLRVTNKGQKIFIDCTGIIKLKDGYFSCSKTDVLITYLFNALVYLLYQRVGLKMMNNSSITISATECFVSMFDFILDYLRIVGYKQSKERICYLAGLYFLYHMLGKDLDSYTKNIAAKAAGLSGDLRAFDLYYDSKDFENINTFITLIANTFKLKGLTTEVFVAKWCYLYQTGTQYGTELFTAFGALLTSAYCGSYIVNQKQIEKCCANSMVKFATSVLKMGADEFDNRGYMEQSEVESLIYRDKAVTELAESFAKKIPEEAKYEKEDMKSKDTSKKKVKAIVSYYRGTDKTNKISGKVFEIASLIIRNLEDEEVAEGVLEAVLKEAKSYIAEPEKRKLNSLLDSKAGTFNDKMVKFRTKNEKDKATFYAKRATELRKCKALV